LRANAIYDFRSTSYEPAGVTELFGDS